MRNLIPWFEARSFFLGLIVAGVIGWALSLLKPTFRQFLEALHQKRRERVLQGSADLENAHRKIIFRQTQGAHLTASLFALDEIALETRLLAPPSYAEPNAPRPHIEITEQAIPYLPAYPEVAAIYQGATLFPKPSPVGTTSSSPANPAAAKAPPWRTSPPKLSTAAPP